jgi:hypothetical protein
MGRVLKLRGCWWGIHLVHSTRLCMNVLRKKRGYSLTRDAIPRNSRESACKARKKVMGQSKLRIKVSLCQFHSRQMSWVDEIISQVQFRKNTVLRSWWVSIAACGDRYTCKPNLPKGMNKATLTMTLILAAILYFTMWKPTFEWMNINESTYQHVPVIFVHVDKWQDSVKVIEVYLQHEKNNVSGWFYEHVS